MHDDENEINEYLVYASKDLSKYTNKIYQALIRYLRGPSTLALLTIEIQPHNFTIAKRPFLHRSWVGKIYGEFQRFFMWSSDEGLAILRMRSELFTDKTFRVTPHPFVRCLIVMSFDPSKNLFFPCVWPLMSRRNEYL
ncbi:hypothetical protein HZS_1781 [Henneguya salminicola]|nr:hypothetical protein HZS_1781 [Henneguya salminicola]